MEKKLFTHRFRRKGSEHSDHEHGGREKDGPPGYEGKEHVKYKDPGYAEHDIKLPEDEPHMKSHSTKEEAHEMEDQYWMKTPKQTEEKLASKLKRANMKMDAPDQEEPEKLHGNLVEKVSDKGEEDEDKAEREDEGPNDMQKEGRKKLIVAVMKRKMHKHE